MSAGEFARDESAPDGPPDQHRALPPRVPLERVPRERFVVPGDPPSHSDFRPVIAGFSPDPSPTARTSCSA